MAAEQSMWHVNDVVAYDLMRELSNTVQAHLLDRLHAGDHSALDEVNAIRQATITVDGYDRTAVDAWAQQLQQRDARLAQTDLHDT
jgi:hypothetical protein